MRRNAFFWLAWFAVGWGFYLLLAGTLSPVELGAGAAAASIGATAAVIGREESRLRFAPTAAMIGKLAQLPPPAVRSSVLVLVALAECTLRGRRVEGVVRAIPLDTGTDAHSSARRALQDIAVCVTPTTVSLGTDRAMKRILIHQLLSERARRPALAVRM
jgi:multisubunit Na+/H+ antiporter MnhE subunit